MGQYDDAIGQVLNGSPAAPPDNGYGDTIDQFMRARTAQGQAATYGAKDVNPDHAAEALTISQQTGVPQPAVLGDLPGWRQRASLYQAAPILQSNPALADWMAANPVHAQVAQDDLQNMSLVDNLAANLKEGWSRAVEGNELGRLRYAGATDQDPRVTEIEKHLAEPMPAGGLIGYPVRTIAGLLGGFADMAAKAAPLAAGGATLGAGLGALGGPLAPATSSAGAIAGAGAGFMAGLVSDGFKVGYGNLKGTLGQITDSQGNHLDPAVTQGAAIVGGLANGMLQAVGLKVGAEPMAALPGLLSDAAQEMLSRPTYRAAATALVTNLAKSAGTGAAFGLANEGSNILAEQAARVLSQGDFATVLNDPGQRAEAVQRLASAMGDMAIGMVGLHALPLGANLGRDLLRARQAEDSAGLYANLADGAAQSKVRDRAPSLFQNWLQQQTDGSPVENLFMPADTVRELYQRMGVEPGADDPVFGRFMPDIAQQLDQAQDVKGDIVVPTAGFLTHLAGTDVERQLRPDIRVTQDGMSLNEAAAFREEYAKAMADQHAQLADQFANDEARRSSLQQITDDFRAQARGGGYAADAADQYAALVTARYATRGERLGEDPLDLYRAEGIQVRPQLPESIGAAAPDQLDTLINAVRSGKRPSDATLNGPSLMEFLARRGGVQDPGGDLASMGVNEWHRGKPGMPRFLLPSDDTGPAIPGMGGEKTANRLGIDGATEAAHEAGYLRDRDIGQLHAAVGEEMAGRPRYSERAGDPKARAFWAAADDLSRHLDALGIDAKTTSTAEIRAALAKGAEGRQFAQPGEPVAHLTGEEIAPAGATLADLRTAARDFYANHLAGRSVENPTLGKIEFSNRGLGKAISSSANPLKLQAFAAVEDVLKNGTVVRSEPNSAPGKTRAIVAYHYVEAPVEIGGTVHRVGVTVEEHADGKLYYNHNLPDQRYFQGAQGEDHASPGRLADSRAPGAAGAVLPDTGPRPPEESVAEPADRLNLNLGQPDGSGLRGSIQLGDGQAIITLFGQRNLSTLLHESGHLWLDEMTRDAAREDPPEQIKADMAAITRWLGVDSPDQIGVDQHEHFARGVEAYLMEGKAPAPELVGVFQRFKSWLVGIYRTVAGLHVALSPEIRDVFDRMLATDDQIDAARRSLRLQQLFPDAKSAVMTDAEFSAYQRLASVAKSEASDALMRKALADVTRRAKDWWKEQEAPIREEVTREVDRRPAMAALELLKTGKLPGADPEAPGVRMRLDRDAVARMLDDPSAANMLPRDVMAADGVHPDIVAEMVGLRGGRDLLDKLMGVEAQRRQLREQGDRRSPRQYAIDEETRARMVERHGDMMSDGSIADAAAREVHNRMQLQTLAVELRALGRHFKAFGGDADTVQAIRDWASRTIGEKSVRDATALSVFSRAEGKAGRAAFAAMEAGKPDEAYLQKRAQALNHALFIEGKRAADDVEKGVRFLSRLASSDTIKSIAQQDLDQIHDLLDRFDFGKAGAKEVAARESLRDWVERKRAEGFDPPVPDKLLDQAYRDHYTTMAVDEFRGLVDTVKSMVHIGRLRQTLLDRQEQRAFQAVVDEMVETAGRLPQLSPEMVRNPGVRGAGMGELVRQLGTATKHALRSMDASLIKMDQMFQWLDNRDSNGVFQRVITRRLSEAQTREHDLQAVMTGKLKALGEAMPKATRDAMGQRLTIPELIDSQTGAPSSMLKSELLAVALNTGNLGNMDKLLRGERWSAASVKAALDQHMTADDWHFVQGMWDAVDHLWPEIEALEKRVNGVAPEKVEAREVMTPHGTFRGGYYPVVYDPLRSYTGEKSGRGGEALFSDNYVRAATNQGHTIARTGAAAPLYLSLDVVPRHLQQVIHDLAWREAIMDVDRITSTPQVRAAIDGAMGQEYRQQIRPWLQAIANDKAYDPRGLAFWDRVAHFARTNATIVGLGFRMSTIVVHGAGAALNSVGEVGLGPMTRAVSTFIKDPGAARDFIFEKSGEMRNRLNEVDRDMRDTMQRDLLGQSGPLATVRRGSMMGVAMIDMASALPTWLAAYETALKGGMDDADAVAAADLSVRNAHGAGAAKDHAAIQRGSEFQKLFTMFYSFWNHMYNRQRDLVRAAGEARSARDFGALLGRSFFYLIAPSIIHGLVSGGSSSQSDNETWGAWAAKHVALGLAGGVPIARDLVAAAEGGRSYAVTPAAGGVQIIGTALKDAGRALGMIQGDPSDRWVQHAVQAPGYVFGLPTGQASGAAQYLWDVWRGQERPEDVRDWLHGVMYGPAPKNEN